MKKIIISILAVSCMALGLQAQNLKIVTVDMAKLYGEYYKTKEANEKLQGSLEKAQEQLKGMAEEGQSMVDELNGTLEMVNNPALTEEARQKAQGDAETMAQQIKDKERDIQQFQLNTQRSIQQRQKTYRDLFVDEIKGVVMEVARERNGTLVLDTSNVSASGIPDIIYSEPSWDITDEVLSRINADAPAEEEASSEEEG